jgi:hypothetical protein
MQGEVMILEAMLNKWYPLGYSIHKSMREEWADWNIYPYESGDFYTIENRESKIEIWIVNSPPFDFHLHGRRDGVQLGVLERILLWYASGRKLVRVRRREVKAARKNKKLEAAKLLRR